MSWIFYALLSALFAAFTALFAKIGLKGVDSNLATAIRTSLILVLTWGIVFAQGLQKQLPTLPKSTYWFLALSAVATGLSWLFYFKALQLGPVSKVVALDKLSLVIAVLLAVLFLREKVTPLLLAGVVFMTVGALMIGAAK